MRLHQRLSAVAAIAASVAIAAPPALAMQRVSEGGSQPVAISAMSRSADSIPWDLIGIIVGGLAVAESAALVTARRRGRRGAIEPTVTRS
jgi:hypothetical protein